MDTVSVSIKTDEKASRIELFVRLLYWIPLAIVMWILMLVAGILYFVNIFAILILGKRVGASLIAKAIEYQTRFTAYMMLATDERPPIMPQL